MNFQISMVDLRQPASPLYQGFRRLHAELFSEKYTLEVEFEISRHSRPTLWVAHAGSEVVGFKLGYETGMKDYYSWAGGVAPQARNNGIASALMKAQHEWCREQGYKRVQTKTKNKWRDMLILNLRSDFNIIGCYTDPFGEPKLILEKIL